MTSLVKVTREHIRSGYTFAAPIPPDAFERPNSKERYL
jgi:hypothetical protein